MSPHFVFLDDPAIDSLKVDELREEIGEAESLQSCVEDRVA